MKRAWPTAAGVLTGIFAVAMTATPQAYTISAKPGVINYIEGNVFLDGKPVSAGKAKATFVNAGQTVSTDIGKAEVLLTPGVFLRLGENTQVKMIAPSLTDTQIEVKAGEAMVEADDIVKDSRITVLDGGATVRIDRNGLFKITAGESPRVAVLEGKTSAYLGDRKVDIGKGRELLLADAGKPKKFDAKKPDELYAWSNVRSEYNAAASYQTATDANLSGYGGVWGGYGFSGYANPGWAWNSAFNTYSWLPGGMGAFYSPFGYGFYGPGSVGYAPVIYAPIYGGGGYGYRRGGVPVGSGGGTAVAGSKPPTRAVPVNAARPPAMGGHITSPMESQAVRDQMRRTFSSGPGFRTGNGAFVPAGRSAPGFGGQRMSSPAGMNRGSGGGRAPSGGFSGGAARGGAGMAGPGAGAHGATPAARAGGGGNPR